MPRAPRISGPDTLHHVVAHGVDERPLYRDDADRWTFIGHLGDVTRKARWALLAFCLMETHYHLVLRERDMPLSRGM